MVSHYSRFVSVLFTLGAIVSISVRGGLQAADRDPALPPFEFHRTGAASVDEAAKALIRGCARGSINDFVQHLQLGVCDGPVGTIQKFAECLHTIQFKTGEESFAVFDLPVGKNGGLKHDTIRIVTSNEFPSTEKVEAVIIGGALSSYYGEKFWAVDVAADGSDGREYRTRVVVAMMKEGCFAVPRCRSSREFYEIADAMPAASPASGQTK